MRKNRLTRSLLATVGTAAMAGVAILGTSGPAQAANGVVGQRMEICAQSLYLRTEPAGALIDTLPYGSHFDVRQISPSGDWVYGFSVWDSKVGWVQNGWFC